jgi:hypothetical protein
MSRINMDMIHTSINGIHSTMGGDQRFSSNWIEMSQTLAGCRPYTSSASPAAVHLQLPLELLAADCKQPASTS